MSGAKHQVLLGVTGSGKTFTIANVIKNVNKPTLVISHNKTPAAQLYAEFKGFFPRNAVEYFVSYFDYYQPEAYIPRTDTFIEKDSATNDDSAPACPSIGPCAKFVRCPASPTEGKGFTFVVVADPGSFQEEPASVHVSANSLTQKPATDKR